MLSEDAPAKLNLALHVRARGADGYHRLNTLFAFTRLHDRLALAPAEDWAITVCGPFAQALGDGGDNLVLRAARLFAEATGSRQRFRFRLEKAIPVAAGLGGGSADAAAALRLLARATEEGTDLLPALAARLGSDVPACLAGRPAIGTGRGDRLRPCSEAGLSGLPVLLANPGVPLATAAVFAGWDGIDRGPLGPDWRMGRNDLTASALALAPVVADVLAWLSALPGAAVVRMSGSGATCFALFDGAVPRFDAPPDWWVQESRLL
jgi:4-diphosphocytidyl-2-C-methyl-D-erythritol kinase